MSTPWYSLQVVLHQCIQRGLTFAAFRLPGEPVQVLVQRSPRLDRMAPEELERSDRIFLIAPFKRASEALSALRPDVELSFTGSGTDPDAAALQGCEGVQQPWLSTESPTSQVDHGTMVKEALQAIEHGGLRKVVLSRAKDIPFDRRSVPALFLHALTELPSACVCLVNSPGTGTWLGASPERLLIAHGERVEVDAIAGTMELPDAPNDPKLWGQKERDEQSLVTDHILRTLDDPLTEQRGPVVLHAGNVAHLHTRLSTSLKGRTLAQVTLALHPTPAVCGTPTDAAMAFISSHEQHARGLYAGFWGPWQWAGHSTLYVNIRCMQVFDQHVRLYVGGGITAGSEAGREWEETEHKAQTWERIIRAGQGRIT